MTNHEEEFDAELAELEQLSNGVIDSIAAGKLDEAERDCIRLRARYPNMIDWIERTAAVADARGDAPRAIEHYRLCLEYIARDPDEFDDEIRELYQLAIDRLERDA